MVTMGPDGLHRVGVASSAGSDASWYPDGSGFVYSRPVSGTQRLDLFSITSPDGWIQNRLTNTPRRDDIYPLFSPDGTMIAFMRTGDPDEVPGDLFTMTVNGANVRRLTDTPRRYASTRSWQATA
jgi:Tol biopolymer transport system component